MDQKSFVRSCSELESVERCLQEMRGAKNFEQIKAAWSYYLLHTQRAFTRLRIACKEGPSKGWCDKVLNTRSSDELLKYIHHARNVDEHGVEEVTATTPGQLAILSKPGLKGTYIDHLRVSNDGIEMGPAAAASLDVTFTPGEIKLVSVRDRGVIYGVPTSHLGQDFADPTLLRVGEAGAKFLREKIEEAEASFGGAR